VRHAITSLALAVLVALPAQASVPVSLSFQGYVETAGGVGWTGGGDIAVRLYGTETGGAAVWEEVHASVGVLGGVFSLNLGQTPEKQAGLWTVLSTSSEVWVGFEVSGVPATFARKRLVSAPYAVMSRGSEDLSCKGCVGPDEVSFGYAAAATAGGPAASALSLACEGCVGPGQLSGDAKASLDQSGDVALLWQAVESCSGDLAAHAENESAHHVRYSDGEAVAAVAGSAGYQALQADVGALKTEVAGLSPTRVNLLPNGSFEMGLALWAATVGAPVLSEGSVHAGSGRYSLVLDSTGGKGSQVLRSTSVVPVRVDAGLEVSAWVSGFSIAKGATAGDAYLLRVEFLDREMKSLATGGLVDVDLGTGLFDWKAVRQAVAVPAGGVYARVSVGLFGTAAGVAMADDVRLDAQQVDVGTIPYAGSAYPGGPASDVECAGCVGATDVASGFGLVPSGAILMFEGVCPAGWKRYSALDGRFVRGAATSGATGGTDAVDSTHSHAYAYRALSGSRVYFVDDSDNSALPDGHYDVFAAETAWALNPPRGDFSGWKYTKPAGASFDNRPAFREMVFCKKD
jgi:hypothetical protein